MMANPGNGGDLQSGLTDLAERLRPQVIDMLQDHRVPLEVAREIVEDALGVVARHWNEVREHEVLLMDTVKFRCRRYVKDVERERGA